jgi:hypothetical protein
MIDVFNATSIVPQMAGQHLAAQVADGIALDGSIKNGASTGQNSTRK